MQISTPFLLLLFFISLFSLDLQASQAEQDRLDSLVHESGSGEPVSRLNALLELAEYYQSKDSARFSFYLGQVSTENLGLEDSLRREINLKKVELLRKFSKNKEIIKILQSELKHAKERNNSAIEADLHKSISSSYFFTFEYDSSSFHIDTAITLYKKLKDSVNLGMMMLRKGNIAYSMGNYTKAIEYGVSAKDIFLGIGEDQYLAIAYMQLGNIFYFLKNYEDAGKYYQIASEYYLKNNNKIGAAKCMMNLGLVKSQSNDFEGNLKLQLKALPIIKENGTLLDQSAIYNAVADAFYHLEKYDSVAEYLSKSLPINNRINNYLGISSSYYLKAKVHFDLGRLDSAESYSKEALQLIEPIAATEQKKELYELLFQIYDSKKLYKQALENLKMYMHLKDSLSIDERNIQIIAMREKSKLDEANFELKLMKQKEAIIIQKNRNQKYYIVGISFIAVIAIFLVLFLNKFNQKNKRLNNALILNQKLIQEDLELKESLFKEIHHRVKNNLQIISSMLNMQSQYIDDDGLKEIITECRNRISSMSLIHESLYKREDMRDALFSNYIRNLIPQLLKTYHIEESKINLEMDLEEIQLSLDDSVPAGLIINEIVSNSLKHAFPLGRNGSIQLKLKKTANLIQLIISDDGIGIPEDIEINTEDSFGLLLINLLATQLDAKINIERHNGTKFTIEWESKEDKLLS